MRKGLFAALVFIMACSCNNHPTEPKKKDYQHHRAYLNTNQVCGGLVREIVDINGDGHVDCLVERMAGGPYVVHWYRPESARLLPEHYPIVRGSRKIPYSLQVLFDRELKLEKQIVYEIDKTIYNQEASRK